jgi:hypothetical protein
MSEDLLGRIDRVAGGESRRGWVERALGLVCDQLERGGVLREPGSDLPAPSVVPGQRERVLEAAAKCGVSMEVFTARALSSLLERVDNGYRGPIELPRLSRPGFEGSRIAGHRDVEELGWYRPTSGEAREDVVPLAPFDKALSRPPNPSEEKPTRWPRSPRSS